MHQHALIAILARRRNIDAEHRPGFTDSAEAAKCDNCCIADQLSGQLRDLAGRLLQPQLGFFKLHIEFNLSLLETAFCFPDAGVSFSGLHFGFVEILIIRGTCLPREGQ